MKPVFVLTTVGIFSALLLAIVNQVTIAPRAQAAQQIKTDALKEIFPFELGKIKTVKTKNTVFYEIKKGRKLQGVGVESSSENGYGGLIQIMLAVSPKCKIYAYKVLSHKETPGLGDKMASEESFKSQFKNKTLKGMTWKVKKDGGFVDELTAATISSRAITEAIHKGLVLFSKQFPGRCK